MFKGAFGGHSGPGGGTQPQPMDLLFGNGRGIGRRVQGLGRAKLTQKERSTYVLGTHGSGKSTLVLNRILEDIAQRKEAIIVIDPHRDLAEQVLLRCPPEHASRVIYFDPLAQQERPFALNPFEWESEVEYHKKSGTVANTFAWSWYGSFRNTPTLQATLSVLVKTLFTAYPQYGCHFGHLALILREDEIGEIWRARLSGLVQDDIALSGKWSEWRKYGQRKADTESTRGKVTFLLSNRIVRNILCQSRTTPALDFARIFMGRDVLVCSLYGLDEEDQRLLGGILLGQVLTAAFLRAEQTARVPVHLYVDEFHLFPSQIFVDVINAARKYGLYVTLTNQNLTQIDQEARAAALSCGNVIAMTTTPSDARILQPHFDPGEDFPEGGLHRLEQFQAVARLASGTAKEQAWITTYPERGQEDKAVYEAIFARSAAYGKPRIEVEQALAALSVADPPAREKGKKATSKQKSVDRPSVRFWER